MTGRREGTEKEGKEERGAGRGAGYTGRRGGSPGRATGGEKGKNVQRTGVPGVVTTPRHVQTAREMVSAGVACL